MEMHLVHWKLSYGLMEKAIHKRDGLAVISILFNAKKGNEIFSALKVKQALSQSNLRSNSYILGWK